MNEVINENISKNTDQTVNAAPDRFAPVPPAPEKKPFAANRAEIAFAFLSYVAAYFYVLLWFNDLGYSDEPRILWRVLPVAVFAACAVLILNRGKKKSAESWFWLACFVSLVAAFAFRLHGVWDEPQLFLLIHACLIWWTLSHSGKLLEGVSSRFLPVDGTNGLIIIPFRNFFLRIRCVFHGISRWIKRSKKGANLLWTALAVLLAVALFAAAAGLLMQADSNFAQSLDRILRHLEPDEEVIVYVLCSLPVGAYIFGLIGGSVRMEEEFLRREKSASERFLAAIRRVPAGFWAAVILLFSALYVAFFALQTSYFLGAFTHTLPEGFIVSRYAREGFFELCRVMAINFALLWLVTRMSEKDTKNSRLLKFCCLLLLFESLLFAVIAASKIILYVSDLGWTPKRIQSLWLVGVLAAACLAWGIHLISGKKTFKPWLMLSAGTLCVLAFLGTAA